MTCSILIKSWIGDFLWLSYCLRSIQKFATGFDEVVVIVPEGCDLPLTKERLIKIPEPITTHGYTDFGYINQQCIKMNADKYVKSDFVCHMDSDSIFVKPVTPNDLMIGGKPLWLMTPMADVIAKDKNAHAHATSMKNFSGIESEFEYMRRIGQIIPRWAYACFREYCYSLHKKTFEEWAHQQAFRGVTEFNHLGQLLHREYPNFIHFHDTRFGIPDSFVRQFWSWSGLDNETRELIESMLA